MLEESLHGPCLLLMILIGVWSMSCIVLDHPKHGPGTPILSADHLPQNDLPDFLRCARNKILQQSSEQNHLIAGSTVLFLLLCTIQVQNVSRTLTTSQPWASSFMFCKAASNNLVAGLRHYHIGELPTKQRLLQSNLPIFCSVLCKRRAHVSSLRCSHFA